MLLVGGVVLWIWPPEEEGYRQLAEPAFWRVGALMAVLWLAYPDVHRMPAWIWTAVPVLIVVLAVRPRWFLFAVPILIVLAILRPRIPPRQ